ncbi:TetR/AcrR family transcriptional regulator [Neobacillus mesonae]|nr:TetR/AcrR family transcriptional regulator [Neobacillus mesonae]
MVRQDKKKQLIEAAYHLFVKQGYLNTSIKDIANEAGITSGLVHYYFKNKEELLLSVQDAVQKQYQSKYEKLNETITIEEAVHEIKSRVEDNPNWYRWRYEIFSLGMKDDSGKLEQEAASILKNGRNSLSTPIQQYVGDSEKSSAMASVLLACFDGLALQKIIDEDFDLDNAYRLLVELIELYTARYSQSD